MAISQRDIKLLWGRAASRCAFPDCRLQLTQDSEVTESSFPIGEQAHIVAKEQNGPRGNSPLTLDERDSYANLILLCPTHHTIIDRSPEDFPIEKLHSIKTDHELWVQQTLSQTWDLKQQARDLIYTSLIDSAVKYCHLSEWKQWTRGALDSPPRLPYSLYSDLFPFREKVWSTDFPGTLTELEKAVKTLSIVLHKAAKVFEKYCQLKKDINGNLYYEGDRPYNISAENFDGWVEECHQLIIAATKAANWFREVVR
ncbi:MAG: HNH endonuclease, partial [Desertifilum sp. SIO1I2]|nr:HNH endonuclease [Desertifilum sp. SIO1I2]